MIVTGGITFIISNRSGRDRHFDARTAVIQYGWYFLKVTVTRCRLIKVMGMTRVTVTAVDLSSSGYSAKSGGGVNPPITEASLAAKSIVV